MPQALGRAGARLRPHSTATSAAARWRTSTTPIRPTPSASATSRSRRSRTASPRSSRWPCRRRCRSKGCSRSATPRRASRAMREAVGDGIDIMVDCHARPSPRMGMLFAKALEPYGLYLLEEPCWPETMDDIALIQRAVTTPIATGERLVGHARVSRTAGEARRQRHSARHHALRRLERSPAHRRAWPRRIAWRWRRTIRRARSAPRRRWSSASPRRRYIICETVHRDVPWRQDVVSEGFTVENEGPHRPARTRGRAWASRSTRRRCRSTRSSRRCCSGRFTRTAAWGIGERGKHAARGIGASPSAGC